MITKQTTKIGFVARGLTPGGVSKFITNVLREWNHNTVWASRIVVFTDEPDFERHYSNLKVICIPTQPKIWWDNVLLLRALRQEKPDVVIYTKNVIPLTHIRENWRKVVVVHDLAFFYPKLNAYKKADTFYMKSMTKFTLPRADKIMAISNFTKSEIIKFINISEAKIFVNYHGVEKKYKKITNKKILDRVTLKYNLHAPFIFYCGSLSPRKNILTLVRAFDRIKDQISDDLYLISGSTWNNPGIEEYINSHQLGNRIHLLPYIPEDDLIVFYSLADAFVYPSLYEGFGLPLIEAQACACLVMVSNSSINMEIIGSYATFFESNSIEDLSQSLLGLLGAKKNIEAQKSTPSTQYSWHTSAFTLLSQSDMLL